MSYHPIPVRLPTKSAPKLYARYWRHRPRHLKRLGAVVHTEYRFTRFSPDEAWICRRPAAMEGMTGCVRVFSTPPLIERLRLKVSTLVSQFSVLNPTKMVKSSIPSDRLRTTIHSTKHIPRRILRDLEAECALVGVQDDLLHVTFLNPYHRTLQYISPDSALNGGDQLGQHHPRHRSTRYTGSYAFLRTNRGFATPGSRRK